MTSHIEIFQDGDKWGVRKWYPDDEKPSERFDTRQDAETFSQIHFGRCVTNHRIGDHSGHLISIEEWKEACECGAFIDYDGMGDLLTEDLKFIDESNHIRPSDYTDKTKEISEEAKYVLWYNR